jgi:hypothetical protein
MRIVRLSNGKVTTKNETDICVNQNCPFYINSDKVKGWILSSGQKFDLKIGIAKTRTVAA